MKFILVVFLVLVACNYATIAAVAEELPYFAQVDVRVECDCEVDDSTYTCKVKSNTPATESHNAVPVIDICTPCDGMW